MSIIVVLLYPNWVHLPGLQAVDEGNGESDDDSRSEIRRLIEESVGDEGYHDEPNGEPNGEPITRTVNNSGNPWPESVVS